jgi:site-specific DNA-methyltransferase (cytosine-N4-specific)
MRAPPQETKKDRDEVAKIKVMLADHNARNCAECVQIGEHIHRHLERKALPRGDVQRYAKEHFNHDAEYLRRFVRLFVYQDELADAQAWEVATGWHNPYTVEPQRSNNLLTKFWKSRRAESSETDPVRNSITVGGVTVTDPSVSIIVGDCRKVLHRLPDRTFQVCITSPPYHAQRDYGAEDQIGHEASVSEFISTLVQNVFREVKRVLRDDGLIFVVIGDRHASGPRREYKGWSKGGLPEKHFADDLPAGNLLRIPDRLAAGLINDGWVYRAEIIWEKTQITSSTRSRPLPMHEKVLMFAKTASGYKYFADAVQLPTVYKTSLGPKARLDGREAKSTGTRDVGDVWLITGQTVAGGVAPFPEELAARFILLSTVSGDFVLDPFGGSGTTGMVAKRLGRRATLIELNPEFAANAEKRFAATDDAVADLDDAAD